MGQIIVQPIIRPVHSNWKGALVLSENFIRHRFVAPATG
jgi:hypothetical protein